MLCSFIDPNLHFHLANKAILNKLKSLTPKSLSFLDLPIYYYIRILFIRKFSITYGSIYEALVDVESPTHSTL